MWGDIDLRWAYGDLLRSINRYTRDVDHSYDILHDALVRFALIKNKQPIHQPHAYLRTVVRSILSRNAKETSRWLPFPEQGDEAQELLAETATTSPEHLAYIGERLQALRRVLDCMPPRCRDVFFLYRVEGLTRPQIAQQLGISIKTVEYHIKRALVDLLSAAEHQT
jgi:RNA polymerase sigma factor (sigma-70 family)